MTIPAPSVTFVVLVDDNFHYMDESERYKLGEYATVELAVAAAQQVVDEYLDSAVKSGVQPAELMASYVMFGDDPFILATGAVQMRVMFSARDYARERCETLCRQSGQAF